MKPKLAVLPGDGIGPEVTRAALRVLKACLPHEAHEALVGGAAIDATGDPLPPGTVALCRESDVVFLGAVGGPKWEAAAVRPEQGLLRLRRTLDVYANLRPARYLGLPTPLKESLVRQADLLVVRELSGGVYFGEPRYEKPEEAVDTWRQTRDEVLRVAHVAFKLARRRKKHVTSVDKANVLASSRLWRRVVIEVAADYPDVTLLHRYVDAASFEILRVPHAFDAILTDNLFGDILSDEAAGIAGSIGVLPSASPAHGSSAEEPLVVTLVQRHRRRAGRCGVGRVGQRREAPASTGNPSRSAAAPRRSSRQTKASVMGRPSAAALAAASCRASAALRSWTRSSRRAASRRSSDGCTSCHVAAKRSSRPRALLADRRSSRPSRSRREIADSHSTRAPHQASTPESDRYRARIRPDIR